MLGAAEGVVEGEAVRAVGEEGEDVGGVEDVVDADSAEAEEEVEREVLARDAVGGGGRGVGARRAAEREDVARPLAPLGEGRRVGGRPPRVRGGEALRRDLGDCDELVDVAPVLRVPDREPGEGKGWPSSK